MTDENSSGNASWREILDRAWAKPTSLAGDTTAPRDAKGCADLAAASTAATNVGDAPSSAAVFQDQVKAQVRRQIELRIEEQRRKILGQRSGGAAPADATTASAAAAKTTTAAKTILPVAAAADASQSVRPLSTTAPANLGSPSPATVVAPRAWTGAWWNAPGVSMLPGLDSPKSAHVARTAATATAQRTSSLLASAAERHPHPLASQVAAVPLETEPTLTATAAPPAIPAPTAPAVPVAQPFHTAIRVPLPTCAMAATTTAQPASHAASTGRTLRRLPVATPDGRMHVVVRVRPLIEEDHRQEMLSKGIDARAAMSSSSSSSSSCPHRARPCVRVDMRSSHADASVSNSATSSANPSEQSSVRLCREFHDDRVFRFGNVLPPDASQEQTYASVAQPIVEGVLRGINGTVLAYGQTGSGKTHTTFGDMAAWRGRAAAAPGGVNLLFQQAPPIAASAGIVPRAVADIFKHVARVESAGTSNCRVYVSFLEVYMENLTDLLAIGRTETSATSAAAAASDGDHHQGLDVGPTKQQKRPAAAAAASTSRLSSYERTLLESRRRKKQQELASLQQQQRKIRERQQQNDWGRGARRTALSADPGVVRKHYSEGDENLDANSQYDDHGHLDAGSRHDQRARLQRKQRGAQKKRAHAHSSASRLAIREDGRTKHVFVANLSKTRVQSPAEVLQLISDGVARRVTAKTMQNGSSSRSHAILSIHLEQWENEEKDDGTGVPEREKGRQFENSSTEPSPSSSCLRSCLTVVDLAGSERVSKSGSGGLRLEEAKKINKSIAALGNCIAARAQQSRQRCKRGGSSSSATGTRVDGNKRHVPFRDSPLTRLLTSTLGGNTFTALIANIGPASVHFDETFSTLLLARRAMKVKNAVRVNRKREKKVEDKVERLEREKRERRERREAERKRDQEEVRALMAREEERKEALRRQKREAEADVERRRSRIAQQQQQEEEKERAQQQEWEERALREEWDAKHGQALLRKAAQTPLRPKAGRRPNSLLFCGAEEKKESAARELAAPIPSVVARPVAQKRVGGLLWQEQDREQHLATPAAVAPLVAESGLIRVQIPVKRVAAVARPVTNSGAVLATAVPAAGARPPVAHPTERERALVQEFSSVIQTLQHKLHSQNSKIKELEARQARLFPALNLMPR